MSKNIYPCLWFNDNAQEAADFYCNTFNNTKIVSKNDMVVIFEIEGLQLMGLNGGPMYSINPSISLFVTCETTVEIELLWQKLIQNGKVMMALDSYPWCEKYGWLEDQFGMTWQLFLGSLPKDGQKIIPNMLFVGNQYGNATAAINHYSDIFIDSKAYRIEKYAANEVQAEGNLKFGHFALLDQHFSAMDGFGGHEFEFNEAVSFVVSCKNQAEIDYYWSKLFQGGSEGQCGWLKDKFGVSWQIVPEILSQLMSEKASRKNLIQAFMKMKKFDIQTLIDASKM